VTSAAETLAPGETWADVDANDRPAA
jgi:hypothetical protein